VAEEYGLYKHVRFNSEVEMAQWDDREKKWKVNVTVSGDKDSQFGSTYTLSSDFLVSAVGQLNVPREPDIPGLKSFTRKLMHLARWDRTYNYKNKRIAIIGNGEASTEVYKYMNPADMSLNRSDIHSDRAGGCQSCTCR
jgi:cation diffusion facilitator CzcD-associated flavoprotein CzcO